MSEQGLPARRSAIWLLNQVMDDGRLMSELVSGGALQHLSPPDRARAQRLAMDSLRGLERADRLLQKHLQKYPPTHVRNALRLGATELCQGGAAHGVVNDLVSIVGRHKRHGRLKGLVNAVLRKVAADGPEAWNALRSPRLPKWLRKPLVDAWGNEAMMSMERAHADGAPLDLTCKSNPADWAARVGGTLLPTGTIRLNDAGQVSALPGFEDGAWWVQDAAAALPAKILGPQSGETVLDLCAAPGGKTLQCAAAGANVTAVDISKPRLSRLQENLSRTGLKAKVLAADALNVKGEWDAILLDAPCSATGTIRRHPDLPFAKNGSEFGYLIDLQARLFDHAWTLLKPGGRLVFCTCSLLPDEGEVQLEDALSRHSDMALDPMAFELPGVDATWKSPEGGLRLRPDYWPDIGGMDGFFVAAVKKAN